MSASNSCMQQHISSIDSSTEMEATQKNKEQLGGWKAIPYILANETFERLAVSGFVANLMVYLLRVFHLDQVSASNINNLWNGLIHLAPLVGAFISDGYVGRFWTIAFSSFFSLLGTVVVTLTASLPQLHPPPCTPQEKIPGHCVRPSKSQIGFLILGLGFLTIGAGGVRPCSIPFGVDQFDPTTDEGKKGIHSFISWYYATFAVIMSITLTVVIYIQESVSWKLGFGIPTACMCCSIIIFFVGSRLYVRVNAEGSIFSGIAQVLVSAYRKRQVKLPGKEKVDEIFYDPPLEGTSVSSKLPLTNQFRFLNKAALIMEGEINSDGTRVNPWRIVSIHQVEEVKCLARIFPIWTANILSLTSMAQQWTFTISQALQMDRHIGPKFLIPPASLSVISFVTVFVCVPIYERALIPTLRKITKHERGITVLQRMGIGMVFSILSMVVAGIVEKTRRDLANSKPNAMSNIASMSVWWLAPQVTLMGLFEAFNLVGQVEFFNRQFPEHMRSIANALFSCSFGLANYVSSFLLTTVHHVTRRHGHLDWLTNDLNAGRLNYFYFLIAGIGVLNLVYYLYVASKYQYKGSVEQNEGQVVV